MIVNPPQTTDPRECPECRQLLADIREVYDRAEAIHRRRSKPFRPGGTKIEGIMGALHHALYEAMCEIAERDENGDIIETPETPHGQG